MQTWITTPLKDLTITAASAILILAVVIGVVRVAGLRSFAKMSSIDFASTIAIGSIIASVVMSGDQSVVKGAVALATVVGFQQLFGILKRRYSAFEEVMENRPTLLMRDGEIFEKQLTACGVSRSDLVAKLREANVLTMSEVRAVVFETTGDISVLHGGSQLDETLLEGVGKK